MGVDERILHLVRAEVDKALASPDGGEAREDRGLISRLDDLHTELHALATKVDGLERRLTALETTPRAQSEPGTVAGMARPRTRKETNG